MAWDFGSLWTHRVHTLYMYIRVLGLRQPLDTQSTYPVSDMEIASEKQDGMDPPCLRLIFRVIGELLPRQEHTDVEMVLT